MLVSDPREEVTPVLANPRFRLSSCVAWLTGLSGSGKTTIALEVARRLRSEHRMATVLDGDVLRGGLASDLGFSVADRFENVRRAAYIAAMMADAGLVVLVALISPRANSREAARAIVRPYRFFEVHVNAPLEVCEKRDVKGLYRRARLGGLANFTGVTEPYEAPERPILALSTHLESIEESTKRVLDMLHSRLA